MEWVSSVIYKFLKCTPWCYRTDFISISYDIFLQIKKNSYGENYNRLAWTILFCVSSFWILYHFGHRCAHSFCSMFSVGFVFVLSGIVVGIEEYAGDFRDKRTVRNALCHSIHSSLKQAKYIMLENDDDQNVATPYPNSIFSIYQHKANLSWILFVCLVCTPELYFALFVCTFHNNLMTRNIHTSQFVMSLNLSLKHNFKSCAQFHTPF